jgi:hypothetical protein
MITTRLKQQRIIWIKQVILKTIPTPGTETIPAMPVNMRVMTNSKITKGMRVT